MFPKVQFAAACGTAVLSFARISEIFLCAMRRGVGCGWRAAPRASMDRRIATESCWSGGIATARSYWWARQVWGEQGSIGRPAILDMPVGHGHVVSFNFNPMHCDMNRGDHRMLWNAILNWRAILGRVAKT